MYYYLYLFTTIPLPPPSLATSCPPPYTHSFSPCGKKFRSKPQIARFLGDNIDLTCFDFSRAGSPGDGSQRRRARDRTLTTSGVGGGGSLSGSGGSAAGNITTRRSELRSSSSKPLSTNPLRPSGPVRRTCGVIKLPVMWVAPPNDDQMRDTLILLDQKREVALHLIVQTLWERRLYGVKPCDHATGSDIAAHKQQNGTVDGVAKKSGALTQTSKPQSPSLSHVTAPFHTSASYVSPLASQSPRTTTVASSSSHSGRASPSTNGLTASQQQTHPSSTQNLGTSVAQAVELSLPLITDGVLRAQEERVKLIRRQLLAAQGPSS